MNFLVAKAEMAVRITRWGDGIGGTTDNDPSFVKITVDDVLDRLREREKYQVRRRTQILKRGLKKN
ncbi:MAG: hypothetical protein HY882_04520 [Deltaproteobacteria bacterium]|nr:hypothetical protein [Deltaproteobacteria bacterium]